MKDIQVVYMNPPNGEDDKVIGEFDKDIDAYICKLQFIVEQLGKSVSDKDDSFSIESKYLLLEHSVEICHLQNVN